MIKYFDEQIAEGRIVGMAMKSDKSIVKRYHNNQLLIRDIPDYAKKLKQVCK